MRFEAAERVYIIAPNYQLAQLCAMRHGISRKAFQFVHRREDLLALTQATPVLWCDHDARGSFDFDEHSWDILRTASDLANEGRITLRRIGMEESGA